MVKGREDEKKRNCEADPPSIDLIWQTVLDHADRLSKIEGSLSSIKWIIGTFLPVIVSLIIYILSKVGV